MSRFTQKPAVGILNPFGTAATASNYTGTSTPISGAQAYSAIPATGAQPSSGTGFYDPNFCTYVGESFETSDGRTMAVVAVGVNGSANILQGKLVAAPAQVTAFQLLAMTVPTATPATAGSFQILVTNGATVLNVNQFQGGYVIIGSLTGAGQQFKIASHQAAAASATFLVTLEDAIQITLDATSTVSLIYNPFGNANYAAGGVIISPTTDSAVPIGVAITTLAFSTAATYNGTSGALTTNGTMQYGLVQTHGPVAALIDNTVTNVGYPLGQSAATAGALGVATLTTKAQIAISGQTQTSGDYGMVFLQL